MSAIFKSVAGLICGNELWVTITTTGLMGGDGGHGGRSSVNLSFDCLDIDVERTSCSGHPTHPVGFVVTAKGDWETQLLAAALMLAGSQLAKAADLSWFEISQSVHYMKGEWVEEGNP